MDQSAVAVTVGPGSVLVVRYEGPLTSGQAAGVREQMGSVLPGVEVVVVIVGQSGDLTAGSAEELVRVAMEHPGRTVRLEDGGDG